MRTDPRMACANADERKGWAFVHDVVAHPLMGLTNWSAWSLKFHDWTSNKAWPRVEDKPFHYTVFVDSTALGYAYRLTNRHGKFWTADSGHRQYSFIADDMDEAMAIAELEWAFQIHFEQEKTNERT